MHPVKEPKPLTRPLANELESEPLAKPLALKGNPKKLASKLMGWNDFDMASRDGEDANKEDGLFWLKSGQAFLQKHVNSHQNGCAEVFKVARLGS